MIAAATERMGTRHVGANRPADAAAASAPSTIPTSITDVTSTMTGAFNEAACAGAAQYGHDATCTATIAANGARLRARPAYGPSIVTSDIGFAAGVALHHGACAVPITDPAMNAASVANMRVLPPPAVYNVPDAHPPPSCMPTPN